MSTTVFKQLPINYLKLDLDPYIADGERGQTHMVCTLCHERRFQTCYMCTAILTSRSLLQKQSMVYMFNKIH